MKNENINKKQTISAQRWQTIFNTINDAIFFLSRDSIILHCNQAMCNMLGKPIDEIIGHFCYEIMHGTEKPIEGCPAMRALKSCQRETFILSIGEKCCNVIVDPLIEEDGSLALCYAKRCRLFEYSLGSVVEWRPPSS